MAQEGDAAWKAFQPDTKAGRLLHKLYGSQKKVEIQYPGLRVVEGSTENRGAFVPGGGKHDVNARTNRIKKVEVLPDYEGKPRARPAPVQYLRGRRKQGTINEELAQREASLAQNVQRYDHTAPSREVQKAALQADFQFKGGKALPAAGMVGALDASDAAAAAAAVRPADRLSEEEQLFAQVVREIEDRQRFLADMAAVGDHTHDARVTKEIEERIKDMDMLNKLIEQQKREARGGGQGGRGK